MPHLHSPIFRILQNINPSISWDTNDIEHTFHLRRVFDSPNAYGLDSNTGKSLWRFRHRRADRTTNGLGSVFFFTSELATQWI
jgi:outer membrane protein assembly factor BamB